MHRASDQQNFWPGYLDALINVMLNLLFLVAIFAMCSVSLGLNSMKQMNQVNRLKEQATEVVGTLDLDGANRQAMLQKIENLNISAMLANREELGRLRQSTSGKQITPADEKTTFKTSPSLDAPDTKGATDRPEEKPSNDSNAVAAVIKDKRKLIKELEAQIKDTKTKITQEKVQLLVAQQNRSPAQMEPVSEIRSPPKPGSLIRAAKSGSVGDTLVAGMNLKPQVTWEFPPGDFVWPTSRALPDGFQAADKSEAWKLLGFFDPTNARVRREVFARMQVVRELLIERSFSKERIQLELRPLSEFQSVDEQTHRFIFMLPQS
jgi:hypothetical protein